MDYCGSTRSPNQWNPETPDDNAVFDRYMRRLATVSDEDYARREAEFRASLLVEDTVPAGADRLTKLAVHFGNFLKKHEATHPCPFKSHTPADARRYVGREA